MTSDLKQETKKIILVEDNTGAQAVLFKSWLSKDKADKIWDVCKKNQSETGSLLRKAKEYNFGMSLNRQLWACGDPGTYHEFRDIKVPINEWPDEFLDVREKIINELEVDTNFCLHNRYLNGSQGLPSHTDGELYAKHELVLTLSLGATRTMVLEPIKTEIKQTVTTDSLITIDKSGKISFKVEHGDAFLMWKGIQKKWKHGLPAEPSVKDVRDSLTFRSTRVKKG